MARTLTLTGQVDMKRDSAQEDTIQQKLADQSITHYSRQNVTLATNTSNQDVPFPTGLTTATFGMVVSSGSTMTYSADSTSTHHKLADGGLAVWNGNFTSLCLSNNSTAAGDSNTPTVIIAG